MNGQKPKGTQYLVEFLFNQRIFSAREGVSREHGIPFSIPPFAFSNCLQSLHLFL